MYLLREKEIYLILLIFIYVCILIDAPEKRIYLLFLFSISLSRDEAELSPIHQSIPSRQIILFGDWITKNDHVESISVVPHVTDASIKFTLCISSDSPKY